MLRRLHKSMDRGPFNGNPSLAPVLDFSSRHHAKRSRDVVPCQDSGAAAAFSSRAFSDSRAVCSVSAAAQDQGSPEARPEQPRSSRFFPRQCPHPHNLKHLQAADESAPDSRLGTGDLLDISVYNVPELNTKSRLGNNGDVYLPLIDYVHLAGLTVEEAQALIEKRLSDGGFVKNPHVTLNVDQSGFTGSEPAG